MAARKREPTIPWSQSETHLAIYMRVELRMQYWEIAIYMASRDYPERTPAAIQQHIRIYRPFTRLCRPSPLKRAA